MQKVFYAYKKETEVEISAVIGKKEKAYSDGEFIKNCLELVTRRMFPEKKCVVEQPSLFRFTVAFGE